MSGNNEAPASRRLVVGFEGTQVDDRVRALLRETGAGSVILFARNLIHADQCRELIADLRSCVDWPLMLCVDQEGGAVVRLTEGITVFPGNLALRVTGDLDLARRQGLETGRQLLALGFDLNLAPVVDLLVEPENGGLGLRSFGADQQALLDFSEALVGGQRDAGLGSCLKHFPGLGAGGVDPHLDVTHFGRPVEELYDIHLQVYRHLFEDQRLLSVMSTHMMIPDLDAEEPVTFSRRLATGLLREELGFDGLLISDDLEMGGVHRGMAESALAAARAGHDLMPICHTEQGQRAAAELLNQALDSGELDRGEHDRAIARWAAIAEQSRREAQELDVATGEQVAREIAKASIHLHGDARSLLPIPEGARVLILAQPPQRLVGIEEKLREDFEGSLRQVFEGLGQVTIRNLGQDPGSAEIQAHLDAALGFDRVLLLSWNAREVEGMRFLLASACHTLSTRLIVVHLRNPHDQGLVPAGTTALSSYGARLGQLEVLAEVLRGSAPALGILPRPYRK